MDFFHDGFTFRGQRDGTNLGHGEGAGPAAEREGGDREIAGSLENSPLDRFHGSNPNSSKTSREEEDR